MHAAAARLGLAPMHVAVEYVSEPFTACCTCQEAKEHTPPPLQLVPAAQRTISEVPDVSKLRDTTRDVGAVAFTPAHESTCVLM